MGELEPISANINQALANVLLKTATIDGKHVAFSSETVFLVQLGYKKKGIYKTKFSIKGNLCQALIHYQGLNIGYGYKKRLLVPSFNNKILAREWS
jgi:hypothetical protein